jgi:hypothetical protein
MKHVATVVVILTVMSAVAVCFVIFFISSDAISRERFAQVTIGMTQPQVEIALGAPHRIRHDTANSTAFFYGGFLRLKWCTMEVFFGPDGLVTGKFHDH